MRAVRIPVEGPITVEDVSLTLRYLQDAVGGRSEHLIIPALGVSMYVNERGTVMGLPVNDRATEIAWNILGDKETIVGNVVILGPPEGANHTDVPQGFIDRLEAVEWLEQDEQEDDDPVSDGYEEWVRSARQRYPDLEFTPDDT